MTDHILLTGTDQSVHLVGSHTMNIFMILAPIMSVLQGLPIFISTLVGCCALYYYYLVIGRERALRKERQANEAKANVPSATP